MIPSFTAQKGQLAAKDPQASGTAVPTHWASVVQMVGTAVSTDIPATPPPCHAEDGILRSPQEHKIVPKHTKDMLKFVHCDTFFLYSVQISASQPQFN